MRKKSFRKRLSKNISKWLQPPLDGEKSLMDNYLEKVSSFFLFRKLKKLNKKKLFSSLFIIFIFSVVIGGVVGKFNPKIGNSIGSQNVKDKSDIEITNFNTDFYEGNSLQWKMNAKRASIFTDVHKTELFSVKLRYFDGEEVTATVIADESTVETDTRNVYLAGNVNMRNAEGTIVLGQTFYYNNATEWITSDDLVTIIRTDNSTVTGKGFSADKNLKKISFKSSVRGNLSDTE